MADLIPSHVTQAEHVMALAERGIVPAHNKKQMDELVAGYLTRQEGQQSAPADPPPLPADHPPTVTNRLIRDHAEGTEEGTSYG